MNLMMVNNGVERKEFYYRGLLNWNEEKGYLIGTCIDGQETFKAILKILGIKDF